MVKKKSKKEAKSGFDINGIVSDFLKTFVIGAFKDQLKNMVDDVLESIHSALVNLVSTIGKLVFSGIIFLFGFVFLIFSFVFLTKDYFNLSTGWSLFIWAFILMIFSLIYGFMVMNKSSRE